MNKILMLGGTGTLSKTIAVNANNLGYEVSVLNRGNRNDVLPDSICKIKGNFYDANNLRQCIANQKYNIIIDFLSRKRADIERVFPIFADKCDQYIFISSCCVFRRLSEDFPLVETSPKPNLNWKYNIEKYEAEQSLISLSKKMNLCKYTIVRPYITYDEHRIPIAIAPSYAYHQTILERIKCGKPMFVIDDGCAISTVTYVEDFAKGVLGLLQNSRAFDEDFNVVGDFHYTHREILEMLYRKIGVSPNIISISRKKIAKLLPNYSEMILGDRALDAIFDNTKLKKAVPGLQFSYDLNKGLDKILDYYHNQIESPIDYQYDGQIDRLLKRTIGVSGHYHNYCGRKGLRKYLLFRTLPFRVASFIKIIAKKHL